MIKNVESKRIVDQKPVYNIGVAAELVGVHPRTLRIYEEEGLISPARTEGNTRRYSEADIERLLHIRYLMEKLRVNIAGARVILRMEASIGKIAEEFFED